MSKVDITLGDRIYVLTTDHPASSNGIPVLLSQDGHAYGPWDSVIDNRDARMPSGERYQWQMTARAIASYARDDHPNDSAVLDLVRRFEAVRAP